MEEHRTPMALTYFCMGPMNKDSDVLEWSQRTALHAMLSFSVVAEVPVCYQLIKLCRNRFSYEPHHEQTGFLPVRKQKRRSASQ